MSETKVIFDTSALIELFDLTKKGEAVRDVLKTNNTFFVPSIAVAELISKLKRRNFDPKKFIEKVESSTVILSLDTEIAKRAGELHAELRKKQSDISLADCVIIAHGEVEDAMVLTCDQHFKGYSKAKVLD